MPRCAIIIPFKDRQEHLDKFIPAFKRFISPNMDHEIFVVEQMAADPCNIGRLRNIGFAETRRKFDYFVFHDVDMLPLAGDYSYPECPTLLATNAEQFNYTMPFAEYFGGVTLFNKADFEKCNGYSNLYWGWGGEDCDLRLRVLNSGLEIAQRRGAFACLQHDRDPIAAERNNKRFQDWLTREGGNKTGFKHEGLNSLDYSIKTVLNTGWFTKIQVAWPKPLFY